LLTLSLTLPAHSQSASNFKTPAPKAKETTPPQTKTAETPTPAAPAPEPQAAKPADIQPSRYVSLEGLPVHLDALGAVLTGRKRATDPFGQLQDPEAKPVIKPSVAQTKRAAPMQVTPFADIIRLIKVTTVMPAEKRFLVGMRSIKQGDRIPLAFRGRNIEVEVASVSSRRIEFRNLENGDTAELSLSLMPVGMTPGNGESITAPGMVIDRPNAPIDLDGDPL